MSMLRKLKSIQTQFMNIIFLKILLYVFHILKCVNDHAFFKVFKFKETLRLWLNLKWFSNKIKLKIST